MFNLTDIVSLSKRALVKYNHTIANFFSENVALNVWSDGGEWPRYQQKYDNMFSYIHKLVPRSVNYVECITNAAVISHIQFCRQSSILCGMYVPYNRRFKISMLRHLVDNSPDHKITLIVKSSSLAYYISTILAEHDANAFLKNTHRQSLAASVEILSPAMVLENYLANHKQKYETLVLYDADTVTATYGLFSKILPYISTFPVYVTTLESDMHEACESVAQGAIECPHDNVPMLCLSRADDPESLSANIVVDLPIEGTQRVCVMHKRSVPIIGPDNRFTLLSRNATIEEKTKVAYWTLANGYHLVKKSCVSNPQIEKDDAPYDRFDYYASLLWAIEVVTGVTSGNVVQARQIWEAVGVYSPIVIDPISMHMDGATYINLLSCFKHWYNTEGITWKLYYYSSILHTTFTYEQIVFIHDGTAVTIRVGYVFKVGQSATCRIMVQSSTQLVQQQQIINKPHRLILSQYNLSRIGQSYVGLDMRVGATAIYTRACSQFERPSAMWRVICSVLPMERYIEIQSIIIMWNNILTKIGKPYNINVVVDEFISEFVGSIK